MNGGKEIKSQKEGFDLGGEIGFVTKEDINKILDKKKNLPTWSLKGFSEKDVAIYHAYLHRKLQENSDDVDGNGLFQWVKKKINK